MNHMQTHPDVFDGVQCGVLHWNRKRHPPDTDATHIAESMNMALASPSSANASMVARAPLGSVGKVYSAS